MAVENGPPCTALNLPVATSPRKINRTERGKLVRISCVHTIVIYLCTTTITYILAKKRDVAESRLVVHLNSVAVIEAVAEVYKQEGRSSAQYWLVCV